MKYLSERLGREEMGKCNAKRLLGYILLAMGALLVLFILPAWIWCLIFGVALIVVGVLMFKECWNVRGEEHESLLRTAAEIHPGNLETVFQMRKNGQRGIWKNRLQKATGFIMFQIRWSAAHYPNAGNECKHTFSREFRFQQPGLFAHWEPISAWIFYSSGTRCCRRQRPCCRFRNIWPFLTPPHEWSSQRDTF